MAYNENLANKIRQALAHLPNVEEKKMFGGIAFIVDRKMCLTASADRMMCRINKHSNHATVDVHIDKFMLSKRSSIKDFRGLFKKESIHPNFLHYRWRICIFVTRREMSAFNCLYDEYPKGKYIIKILVDDAPKFEKVFLLGYSK